MTLPLDALQHPKQEMEKSSTKFNETFVTEKKENFLSRFEIHKYIYVQPHPD